MSDLTRDQLIEAEKEAFRRDLSLGAIIRNEMQQSDSEILLASLSIIYSIAMNHVRDEGVCDVTIQAGGNLRRLANLCSEEN